jgi:putative transposase
VVAEAHPEPLAQTGRQVGIDLGVARFLTTSDGKVVANPRFLDAAQQQIAGLQRRKQRAKRGSGNRRRLRRQLAKAWRKVRNQRRDFHHKTARALVDAYDLLALEDLRVAAMTRRPEPKPDGAGGYVTNGAAAKGGLNRSILDAGWGQFIAILTAKAEGAGRRVVAVDSRHTSVTCHACGTRCTRPRQDIVICATCGPLDADHNAARNILVLALAPARARAGLGSGQAPAA